MSKFGVKRDAFNKSLVHTGGVPSPGDLSPVKQKPRLLEKLQAGNNVL